MHKVLTYLLLFLTTAICYCQFGERQLIDDDILTPRYIQAGDLNGDTLQDILVSYSDHLVWYKNLGSNTFSSEIIINTGFGQSFSNAIADLDGDGDNDVLFTSFDDSLVLWYENLDGLGSFAPAVTINNSLESPDDVSVSDLDGDGDLDVLVTSDLDDKITWFENLNGDGDFGIAQNINQGNNTGRFSRAADLDNDGDIDVATVSTGNPNVLWFKNLDGLGNFGEPMGISTLETNVHSIALGDVDGDSDIDIVSAKNAQGKIEVFINDGTGNFSFESLVISGVEGIRNVKLADLDNDDNLDILYAANIFNLFAWHKNLNGDGIYGPQNIIDQGGEHYRDIISRDFDNDGDKDVVGIIQNDGLVLFYENQTILNNDEYIPESIIITPNPANTSIRIDSPYPIDGLQLYSLQGKVLTSTKGNTTTLDISQYPAGVLFLELRIGAKKVVKKIIKQ